MKTAIENSSAETKAAIVQIAVDSAAEIVESGIVLKTKIIDIGDWNMLASSSLTILHGIADFTKIKIVSVMIRNDSEAQNLDFLSTDSGETSNHLIAIQATNISLVRGIGGLFDDASFSRTGFNRGSMTIQYIA